MLSSTFKKKTLEKSPKETILETTFFLSMEVGSVFYPLYHRIDDLGTRLMFIKQMGLIGHEKEKAFLESLKTNAESKIYKSIVKSIIRINKRLK